MTVKSTLPGPLSAPQTARTAAKLADTVALSSDAQHLLDQARQHGWQSLTEKPRPITVRPNHARRQVLALQTEKSVLQESLANALAAGGINWQLFQQANAAKRALRVQVAALHDQLNQAQAIILAQGAEEAAALREGLDLVRQTVEHWYPNRGALALHKKIEGLGRERDMWKKRAQTAEAANRSRDRNAMHAAQRVQEVQ